MNTETKARPKKKGRVGEVRCLNCFTRFRPPLGVERATCPECNFEWYISWKGTLAKIRKPVWDNWEQRISQAQEGKE
jgi:hypothetical protein